jgi:hypothetical protein
MEGMPTFDWGEAGLETTRREEFDEFFDKIEVILKAKREASWSVVTKVGRFHIDSVSPTVPIARVRSGSF